jgi:hypothetical protein
MIQQRRAARCRDEGEILRGNSRRCAIGRDAKLLESKVVLESTVTSQQYRRRLEELEQSS